MTDVTTKLSQSNAVDDDEVVGTGDSEDGRLALLSDAVEFGWFAIGIAESKMLWSLEQAAAALSL